MTQYLREAIAASIVACCGAATASAGTWLTFGELPSQPVNGLTISGLTFAFEVGGNPSDDATYNVDLGIGTTTFLSDPVLEGDASGVLRIIFAKPTPTLSFGLGLNSAADFSPGATVDFYDENGLLLDSAALNTVGDSNLGLSEGEFIWASAAGGASSVRIDLNDEAARFALDNLRFQAVPEAGNLLGGAVAAGLGLTACLRRRSA
ncbi:MAG: hypothetical protein IT581_04955 [Verrucomicrobiales bacterium]|nr:hypothetical protein [Verrucomicrobiales bacterium]